MLRPPGGSQLVATAWGAAILAAVTGTTRILRVAAARGSQPLRPRLPFGCERLVAEAHTFHTPLPCRRHGKGQWLSLTFPLPRLWPARLWKRLAEHFAIAPPWVRARGAYCKTAPRGAAGEAIALPFAAGSVRKRLGQRQSASKNAPATGADRERPRALRLPFTSSYPLTQKLFQKSFKTLLRAVLRFAKFASSGPKAQPKGSVASSER